ncbi:MAG TPA: DUF1343 domain-containing protein, partial [Desulfobacteraceae bacterium]|nr:DUF1343 domain-containing protein [Desulfobacteraceae bacterium]
MGSVRTGLDVFRREAWGKFTGKRLGILANQASVDASLCPTAQVVEECLPGSVAALFGPQHGYRGEDQDNMVETSNAEDPLLRVPIFSLYSDTREPLPHMLENLDLLLVDLQDVGTRVYTFASTVKNCLQACAVHGVRAVVLDRPNPLGGVRIEGNILDPACFSFVGPARIPMRHGLTLGELALFLNDECGIGCGLEILPMYGWHRGMPWKETGLRWLMPSTNMPCPETAAVYPGQVIWEGTNVSEGRGTCRPFEIFGAPFLDASAVRKALDPAALRGCHLQDYMFRPTFHKWSRELCRGFMLHVIDPELYEPYYTSLCLLQAVFEVHPDHFKWRDPPYEYEYEKAPIDLILG